MDRRGPTPPNACNQCTLKDELMKIQIFKQWAVRKNTSQDKVRHGQVSGHGSPSPHVQEGTFLLQMRQAEQGSEVAQARRLLQLGSGSRDKGQSSAWGASASSTLQSLEWGHSSQSSSHSPWGACAGQTQGHSRGRQATVGMRVLLGSLLSPLLKEAFI